MLSNPTARENFRVDMEVLSEGDTEPPTRVPSPRAASPKANDLFGSSGLFANFDLGARTKVNESAIVDTPSSGISPGLSPAPGSPKKSGSVSPQKANGDAGKRVTIAEPEPIQPPPAPPAEQPASPPRKVGNLMKELRNDVAQGAMEFNMDNFF